VIYRVRDAVGSIFPGFGSRDGGHETISSRLGLSAIFDLPRDEIRTGIFLTSGANFQGKFRPPPEMATPFVLLRCIFLFFALLFANSKYVQQLSHLQGG